MANGGCTTERNCGYVIDMQISLVAFILDENENTTY